VCPYIRYDTLKLYSYSYELEHVVRAERAVANRHALHTSKRESGRTAGRGRTGPDGRPDRPDHQRRGRGELLIARARRRDTPPRAVPKPAARPRDKAEQGPKTQRRPSAVRDTCTAGPRFKVGDGAHFKVGLAGARTYLRTRRALHSLVDRRSSI
jgi:hypothetical protein